MIRIFRDEHVETCVLGVYSICVLKIEITTKMLKSLQITSTDIISVLFYICSLNSRQGQLLIISD